MTSDEEMEYLNLAGSWRLICLATMSHAVHDLAESRNLFVIRAGKGRDASHTERWLEGGVGTVSFEECCEVLEVMPDVARKKILSHAERMKRKRFHAVSK